MDYFYFNMSHIYIYLYLHRVSKKCKYSYQTEHRFLKKSVLLRDKSIKNIHPNNPIQYPNNYSILVIGPFCT